jgi:hypothetical protein
MVMWEMASTILLLRSTDVPGGVGNLWMVHMEKLSFLIENRWGIMLSLTLRRMLRLGVVLIDNVWIYLVCLALGWVVRLGMLLIHPTCSIMLWLHVRWMTRLLETRMVIHMVGAGRRS